MSVLELFDNRLSGMKEIDDEYLPNVSVTGASSIQCTDGSLNVATGANGVITLSNAGQKWFSYNPATDVSFGRAGIFNCGYLSLESFGGPTDPDRKLYYGTPTNVGIQGGPLLMTDGTSVGQIYDSRFNPVPRGGDYGNANILNVGSLDVNGYLQIGNAVGKTSQLHMFYDTGDQSGSNFQLVSSEGGCQLQFYGRGSSAMTSLFECETNNNVTLCDAKNTNPLVYVNGVSGLSRLYDTVYNKPPSNTIFQRPYTLSNINASWTDYGSFQISILAQIDTSTFPDCFHITFNITGLGRASNSSNGSFQGITLYIVDNPATPRVDLSKCILPVVLPTLAFTSSSSPLAWSIPTSGFTLQYSSRNLVMPEVIYVVAIANQTNPSFNNNFYINAYLTADTNNVTILPTAIV